jgi:hypothetical protein
MFLQGFGHLSLKLAGALSRVQFGSQLSWAKAYERQMEPEDLKKRFDEKAARASAEAAQQKAKVLEQQAELDRKIQESHKALNEVVIPYFKEIEAVFPRGQFLFERVPKKNLRDNSSAEVSFNFRNGRFVYYIQLIQGNVTIFKEDNMQNKAVKQINAKPKFVYPPNTEPFIASPRDLTREKLGKLVQIAIDAG